MIAPAARPPITPAPTPQPTQRAFAADGIAMVARARAPAAAKAVRVFCIDVPLWGGWRSALYRTRIRSPIHPTAAGIEGDRNPGNLSEICYRRSPAVQALEKSPKKTPMLPCTKAERRAVGRPALL